MKRTRGEKERWEDFEARVGIKRSGGGKKETHNAAPNDITQIIEIKQTYDLTVVCETKWDETKWKSVVCEMEICTLRNGNL